MTAAPKLRVWQRKVARWLLHTGLLFAAMAAPFFVLFGRKDSFSRWAALAWCSWSICSGRRAGTAND